MDSFIWKTLSEIDQNNYWLAIPQRKSILYLRGLTPAKELWLKLKKEICAIEHFASRNVKVSHISFLGSRFSLEPSGSEGRSIFILSPNIFRGKIDPSIVSFPQGDFSEYLKEEPSMGIDFNSPAVKKVAVEILNELPPEKRSSSYWRTAAVFQWIKQNISFSLVPKKIIEHIAQTIRLLPDHLKNDPFAILSNSFNIRDDTLRTVSSLVPMPSDIVDPVERANYLVETIDLIRSLLKAEHLKAVDSVWGIFQTFWLGNCSASQTIQDKMAKCVGMASAFVALLRALKIPSITVDGYMRSGLSSGRHQWALVYLSPYGWLEVDPTNSQRFDEFSFEKYGYEFLKFDPKCETILIPDNCLVSRQYIDECRELLVEQLSFKDKFFKTKKKRRVNSILEILKSNKRK